MYQTVLPRVSCLFCNTIEDASTYMFQIRPRIVMFFTCKTGVESREMLVVHVVVEEQASLVPTAIANFGTQELAAVVL